MNYPLKMLIHHFSSVHTQICFIFMNTIKLNVCSVRDSKMWSMEASTWLILSHYGLVNLLLIKSNLVTIPACMNLTRTPGHKVCFNWNTHGQSRICSVLGVRLGDA